MGLSPLDVLKEDLATIFDLYVDVILHDHKEKQENNSQEVQWVTSKNATWH